ncbi:MAG: response regulator [Acidobacteria bacterium]|nr:response regulator [Acidobacteriota bacterium]
MGKRVLVVDDDADVLELTSTVLRDGGYVVTTAGNGRDGLQAARRENPDLILLDINMPGIDGWEALRLLRLDEITRRSRVAMFSIRYDLREKLEALKRSADDYIVKPFAYDELLERVGRLVSIERTGAHHEEVITGG